jgi:hypothetical protein
MALQAFYSEADLAAIAQVDLETVQKQAQFSRLGFQVEGAEGRQFPADQAARLLDRLKPNTYILLSEVAQRMRQPAPAILQAIGAFGPPQDTGLGPVLANVGQSQDMLLPRVGAQRAWRVLDSAGEIASRSTGRAFTSPSASF